ncbi:MAG TPA: RES family NAD+ phosphorylase [Chitinophagales bacterium]|jgi:RES domain-containing protein|nr:RES family NAD+ phosphorylase [Chitinophagales bacterium]MBP6154457.1 RES family NAD+ phosphorylase [Chitinophagales bacterium]HQV77644.1 RES family NAD+ phosphorylase [Chitinophagales bacterium]HQW78117.1 RES family NAD+ phosphorylase [Chitinophagales bacterium]HRB19867.1 RES family NAD+ phosphorylase [Chitinophagales bacterium]
MLVYRIALERFANLQASGIESRWNSSGNKVIYAASSRALACLENVVHRSGEGLHELFKTLVIEIPSAERIEKIDVRDLPKHWQQFNMEHICRRLGDDWYYRQECLVLQVPSVIIPNEYNYILNTQHRNFKKIKLKAVEPFIFDTRIKQ